MPKDKTETHRKLYECMRREFLEKGFEKASLNNIAKQAGITPAGVYRHYASKEAMFEALVKPVVDDFKAICNVEMKSISEEALKKHLLEGYSSFENAWIDYIYKYFDEFKLLVVCSKGTKYESFFDELVRMEEESSEQLIALLDNAGFQCRTLTKEQCHIAATIYITGLFEVIRHEMPKEKAIECIRFIYEFYDGAWKSVLGVK